MKTIALHLYHPDFLGGQVGKLRIAVHSVDKDLVHITPTNMFLINHEKGFYRFPDFKMSGSKYSNDGICKMV